MFSFSRFRNLLSSKTFEINSSLCHHKKAQNRIISFRNDIFLHFSVSCLKPRVRPMRAYKRANCLTTIIRFATTSHSPLQIGCSACLAGQIQLVTIGSYPSKPCQDVADNASVNGIRRAHNARSLNGAATRTIKYRHTNKHAESHHRTRRNSTRTVGGNSILIDLSEAHYR